MKSVDVFASQAYVHPMYMRAQMPLCICHSTEEFKEYTANDEVPPTVFSSPQQLADWVVAQKFTEQLKNYSVSKYNVWLATGEIYIPDIQTETNLIIYKTTEDGLPLPTDNCYIQLVGFLGVNNKLLVGTSSGLYHISLLQYDITAALKSQFRDIRTSRMGKSATDKITKMVEKKKVMAADVKFVHYLLHSESQISDIVSAGKAAYGNISKKGIYALLQSERIKNLFIQEASKVIPNLQEALLKVYPLEDLTKDMRTMVTKTLEAKDFKQEDAQKALEFIVKTLDVPTNISPMQTNPLIAGSQPTLIQAGKSSISAFDGSIKRADVRTNETEVKDVRLTAEQIRTVEKELAIPTDSYVASDRLVAGSDIKKIFDEEEDKSAGS